MKKLLIISLVFLSGCWHNVKPTPPPEPVVITKFVKPNCGTPPRRAPIKLRLFSWQIIDNRFTLTPEDYENLSYNVTKIWEGVEELKNEVAYYERCLEEAKLE